jgi:hypothetical protein
MTNIVLGGFVRDNAGGALTDPTVELFDRNDTATVLDTASLSSTGYWSFDRSPDNDNTDRYDVRVTNGSEQRFLSYDDKVQLTSLETAYFRFRNPTGAQANKYVYDIVGSVITADRTLTLPLITGTDTLAVLGLAQTFSAAQTFSGLITANGGITFAAGDDIAFTGTTGTNDITLTDSLADALSITRAGTDMVVFKTSSTPSITFTPATTFSGGIANAGTIAAGTWNGTAITGAYINDDIVSGQTEITSGLAAADELLYSDAGTVKRVGVDTLTTYLAGVNAGTVTSTGLSDSSGVISLDIESMTASTTIADADLIVIDDGAGGTLRKMTRAHFIESADLDAINIDGGAIDGTVIGANSAAAGTFAAIVGTTITLSDGQLVFPATQNASAGANTLDDYEEGTWTPTMVDLSSSDESQAYSTQTGRYTKVGNRCYIQGRMGLSSLGSLTTSQQARIAALPFTPANVSEATNTVSFGLATGLALPNASESVTGTIGQNDPHINLENWSVTTGTANVVLSEVSADGFFIFSGWYEV